MSWNEVTELKVKDENLIFIKKDKEHSLKNKSQFIGFNGEKINQNQF